MQLKIEYERTNASAGPDSHKTVLGELDPTGLLIPGRFPIGAMIVARFSLPNDDHRIIPVLRCKFCYSKSSRFVFVNMDQEDREKLEDYFRMSAVAGL